MKIAPSLPDAVDVGRLADHQAAVVDARLHPADVVAHDEQDVGLLLLGGRRSGHNRCQAGGEERRPYSAREPGGDAPHFSSPHLLSIPLLL